MVDGMATIGSSSSCGRGRRDFPSCSPIVGSRPALGRVPVGSRQEEPCRRQSLGLSLSLRASEGCDGLSRDRRGGLPGNGGRSSRSDLGRHPLTDGLSESRRAYGDESS